MWWRPSSAPPPLSPEWRATVGVKGEAGAFNEPFGLAVAADGTIYVADGAGGNRIHAISPTGEVRHVAGAEEGFRDGPGASARFSTPSGLALDATGALYVADTGNDAIRRITPTGEVSTVAQGLNGPIGLAIDPAGRLVVADTYNDRLVVIDASGHVSPLPVEPPLDTPTGVAIGGDGTIYVADTGNNAVHAISPAGIVTTIDPIAVGGLRQPVAIAVDTAGTLYVADESTRVVEIDTRGGARVIAGSAPGYRNGRGEDAQFRRPGAIVAIAPGRLVVSDAGNALVRTVVATALMELTPPASPWIDPQFDAAGFGAQPLLWPLEPLYGPFEIAGTLGEARGEDAGRFHSGIDVRAEHGTPVLAVRDGVVTAPLATGDFGSLNEWVRIGAVTYVHLRVGREQRGDVLDRRFVPTRNERGEIRRMRVKRGARFHTGDVVGSVNPFNHVHLNVGWGGEEYNPLLFRLVQFEDTIAPTIARGGVRLFDAQGVALVKRDRGRIVVSGGVQVIVDAWDQANGNRPNRRLGVYALGYQVLTKDGTPVPGFAEPLQTIRFDQLQMNPDASRIVFAQGSGIPFYGQRRTRFLYIVTNTFRDGVAAPGLWDTTQLAPGDYTLRVHVADINGNEAVANRDVPITVTRREPLPSA